MNLVPTFLVSVLLVSLLFLALTYRVSYSAIDPPRLCLYCLGSWAVFRAGFRALGISVLAITSSFVTIRVIHRHAVSIPMSLTLPTIHTISWRAYLGRILLVRIGYIFPSRLMVCRLLK